MFGLRGLVINAFPSLVSSYAFNKYAGSMFYFVNGSPFYVETLFFFWSSNYLLTSYFARNSPVKRFKWIEIVSVLLERKPPESIGISNREAAKLRKNFGKIFEITSKEALLITNFLSIALLFIFGNGYKTYLEYIVVGIPWTFLYCYFAYNLAYMIYTLQSYAYTIRFVIEARFRHFQKQIRRSGSLVKQLPKLNEIIAAINEYDKFWRNFISIHIVSRLLIVNFLWFLLGFAQIHRMIFIEFAMVSVFEFSIMNFSIYQVSQIVRQSRITRKVLWERAFRRRSPTIGSKIKVSSRLSKVILITIREKYLNFLETMSSDVGIHLWNDSLVESKHIIYVSP